MSLPDKNGLNYVGINIRFQHENYEEAILTIDNIFNASLQLQKETHSKINNNSFKSSNDFPMEKDGFCGRFIYSNNFKGQ